MLDIKETPNSNLELFIPKRSDRVDLIGQIRSDRSEGTIWADLLEPFSCNGSYSPIDPECHALGLTSDPYMLAEEAVIEDNGDLTVCGKLYHYDGYMLRSVPVELAKGRRVILHCWHDTKGLPETRQTLFRN